MKRTAVLCLALGACFAAPRAGSEIATAARAGDVAAIRELRAHGEDPNAPSGGNGWTPLLHAIHTHHPESVAALIDAGADPNRADARSLTPLMMAASYGYTEIVQLLLARGANPNARDLDGDRAIDYALRGTTDIDRFTFFGCQDDTVRAFVRHGVTTASQSARRWASLKRCESASLLH